MLLQSLHVKDIWQKLISLENSPFLLYIWLLSAELELEQIPRINLFPDFFLI